SELFLKRWKKNRGNKGVAIFIQPKQGEGINIINSNEVNIRKTFFNQYIKGNTKVFIIILFISALLALSNLAFPILTRKIVDEAIPHNNYSLVAIIVIAQIIIILSGNIFGFINEKLFIKVTSHLN